MQPHKTDGKSHNQKKNIQLSSESIILHIMKKTFKDALKAFGDFKNKEKTV